MRHALAHTDRASRGLAHAPFLALTWLVSAVPPCAAGVGLVQHTLTSGLPTQAGQMLSLLGWAFLLVLAGAWYLLGQAFLLRQAQAVLRGEPVPGLPTTRVLLDLLPWLARAHGARLGLSVLGLLPLGAGLPLARLVSCPWPVRAALRPGERGSTEAPTIEVVVAQLGAGVLWALLALNLALALSWGQQGLPSGLATLLPRLMEPRVWIIAGGLSLAISEPWRALALIAALGLDAPHAAIDPVGERP